ncbi:MAG: dTDP-4-dehydrorhamnose reductase [Terriglobales bacterium]
MKVAVIGGTGLLGRAIAAAWHGDDLQLVGSRDLDIRDPRQVESFVAHHRPDRVVLAAAISQVDACERDPEQAELVNHAGAVHVAEACRKHAVGMMFLSTDYVFDGSQRSPYEVEDPVAPLSVYGRTKAAAEKDVTRILPGSCIVRVSWLFGAEKKCFANTVLDRAESGEPVRTLADQVSIPNYSHDVARALAALVHVGAQGTVHVTNPTAVSRYDFSRELLRAAGLSVEIEPPVVDVKWAGVRPRYSALSDASLRRYGIRLRDWREALPDYLTLRRQMRAGGGRAG